MILYHWSDLHIDEGWQTLEAVKALVQYAIERPPSAVIITGDIVDSPKGAFFRWAAYELGKLIKAGIPTIVIPGNHDLYAHGVDLGQGGAYELWDRFKAGFTQPISERHGVAIYEIEGQRIVALDTQLGNDDSWPDLARGRLADRQIAELIISLRPGDLVAGHHRLAWEDQAHLLEDADKVIKILVKSGPACAYICGHKHKREDLTLRQGLRVIAAGKCSRSEKGRYVFTRIDLDQGQVARNSTLTAG